MRSPAPAQIGLARLTAGAIALAIMCLVIRQRLPLDPIEWLHLLIVAVLLIGSPRAPMTRRSRLALRGMNASYRHPGPSQSAGRTARSVTAPR